jgi:hypothetical protein
MAIEAFESLINTVNTITEIVRYGTIASITAVSIWGGLRVLSLLDLGGKRQKEWEKARELNQQNSRIAQAMWGGTGHDVNLWDNKIISRHQYLEYEEYREDDHVEEYTEDNEIKSETTIKQDYRW